MNFVKKGIAAALAMTLALGATACGSNTQWVAQAGELTVPAGVYLAQVMDAYYSATSELPAETKNPLKEQVDGVTVSDKVLTDAKTGLNKFIAVEQKFAEMGLTLAAEDQMMVDQMVGMYWQYLSEEYQANGISKDSYAKITSNTQKRELIFNAIYGEGGTEAVPDQELRDKFYNDYAKILMIPLNFSNSENPEQAKELVDKYLKQAQEGKDFEEVLYEAQKEVTGDETLEKPAAGTSFTFVGKEDYEQKVTDAIFGAELGTPTMVETETSYYLFVRYDIKENEQDFISRKNSLVKMLRGDAFNQKLDEWAAAVSGVTYNDAALKRYTPNKLKVGV